MRLGMPLGSDESATVDLTLCPKFNQQSARSGLSALLAVFPVSVHTLACQLGTCGQSTDCPTLDAVMSALVRLHSVLAVTCAFHTKRLV